MHTVACVLLFFSLPQLFSGDVATEKQLYISRLGDLYISVGIAADKVLGEVALPAMILDHMNNDRNHPRRYMHVRGTDIQLLDAVTGEFQITITVQSLLNGVESFKVSGHADFQTYSVKISDLYKYEKKQKRSTITSSGYSTFNNGSHGVDELTTMESNTKCLRKDGHCERGTVQTDQWLLQALQYQRLLGYHVPLNYYQFIGTHNSFNNKADGYGTGDFTLGKILETISAGRWDYVWAQQWFTITDQLNMGVRYLMLDPVYFWGDMRLCHCGAGSGVKWLDQAIEYIEKVLHVKIDFDSHDLGCMPYDRLFSSAIQEINDWLAKPEHSNEFVLLYINDETSDSDWGKIRLIQEPVANITRDILFTPSDKKKSYPDRWPSINEMLSTGKQLLVTCTSRCNNDDIFLQMMVPGWDHDTVKYFIPFPNCTGYRHGDWYLVGGESQVINPIYDGPKEEGLVVMENFQDLLACPLSVVQLDLASPELMSWGVWSWSSGYSSANLSNTSCAVMSKEGRWKTLPCNSTLRHVCVSHGNSCSFNISTAASTWTRPQCPAGMVFGVPLDGYQNRLLYRLVQDQLLTNVWINATMKLPPFDY